MECHQVWIAVDAQATFLPHYHRKSILPFAIPGFQVQGNLQYGLLLHLLVLYCLPLVKTTLFDKPAAEFE